MDESKEVLKNVTAGMLVVGGICYLFGFRPVEVPQIVLWLSLATLLIDGFVKERWTGLLVTLSLSFLDVTLGLGLFRWIVALFTS